MKGLPPVCPFQSACSGWCVPTKQCRCFEVNLFLSLSAKLLLSSSSTPKQSHISLFQALTNLSPLSSQYSPQYSSFPLPLPRNFKSASFKQSPISLFFSSLNSAPPEEKPPESRVIDGGFRLQRKRVVLLGQWVQYMHAKHYQLPLPSYFFSLSSQRFPQHR